MPTFVNCEGNALVYCQGAYNTTNGKTAHGLVRSTNRYNVVAVIDENYEGRDAGLVLGEPDRGIPIVSSVKGAIELAEKRKKKATHLVVGLAPDGGRLPDRARLDITEAIEARLNIDCGLHDFLNSDYEFARVAKKNDVVIRDIRKPPDRKELHFFSGEIDEVSCLKTAVLGTDSAVGKRTTALLLAQALAMENVEAELIGTGQTAWLQGLKYSLVMDSIVNDFVAGEIEHQIVRAWREQGPDVILLEGQGSLMNPAYPGGFELLAAGRPDVVILQHAPARKEYDGFPGRKLHSLSRQIKAIETVSDVPVVAITVNHENLSKTQLDEAIEKIEYETGLPTCAPLRQSMSPVLDVILSHMSSFDYR